MATCAVFLEMNQALDVSLAKMIGGCGDILRGGLLVLPKLRQPLDEEATIDQHRDPSHSHFLLSKKKPQTFGTRSG